VSGTPAFETVLLGLKSDKEPSVTEEEILETVQRYGMSYFAVSAFTAENVEKAILDGARKYYDEYVGRPASSSQNKCLIC